MSEKAKILKHQMEWATQAGLVHDKSGYLDSYNKNLFQPLNPKSKEAFNSGSGSELETSRLGQQR